METNETLSPEIEQLAEGVLFNMNQVAKILDLGYGRNTLFDILRKKRILSDRNEPYQQYISQGYFKLFIKARPGQPHFCDIVTMSTVKGLKFIEKTVSKNSSN
jgi:anti-repressor protein